ncbi:glycine--tRNA ligase subunit beta [candidate division WOR-3 bacterium]|nr:glycine--tRNA ligase subunit beta [candidate division WOR-3 bacterium]
MDRDVLIEIGTEEIPAGYLENAICSFKKGLETLFLSNKISYSKIEKYYTPRRLAVIIKNIALKQGKVVTKIKGPPAALAYKDGKPTKMLKGFASSKGVSVDSLKIETIGKKECVVAEIEEDIRSTEDIICENLVSVIKAIEFPKKMRWEKTNFSFARPIRWFVVILGCKVLSVSVAGVKSSDTTFGNRLISNNKIKINPSNYKKKLKDSHVIVDPGERKKLLRSLIEKEVSKIKAKPIFSPGLLDEVSNLIEYPFVILGSFDKKFLTLPDEVVISAMETHQRYFPVREDSKLMPNFISAINNKPNKEIIKGNEKVLTARLEDAKFYWEVDRKVPIKERISRLSGIKWHKNLGNLLERTERLEKLSKWIGERVDKIDLKVVKEGARLSKVDLTTLMIRDGKEFTNLEGYIGSEYGRAEGLPEEICRVIEDHYKPRNIEDELPRSKEAAVVSLADRIDLIVGSFLAGEKPTGSRDPFGLRQAMTGFIKILLEFELAFPLDELIKKDLELFSAGKNKEIFEEIKRFIIERVGGSLQSKGIRYDIANAVLSEKWSNIFDAYLVAKSMMEVRKDEAEFEKLVIGQKRVSNILEAKNPGEVKKALLKEKEEKELFEKAKEIEPALKKFIDKRDYTKGINQLKKIRPYIDNLFDNVLVMTDDANLRNNRLALLYYVRSLFHLFCDFEEIIID